MWKVIECNGSFDGDRVSEGCGAFVLIRERGISVNSGNIMGVYF